MLLSVLLLLCIAMPALADDAVSLDDVVVTEKKLVQPTKQTDDTVYDPTFEVTLSETEEAAYKDQLGYGEDEIAAMEASRTEQYHTLHGQYGGYGDVYDPDFDYTPSAAEEDAIRGSV